MKLNPFSKSISKSELLAEWTTKRPLPLGRKEFMAWSDRIIAAAMIPADVQSQRAALADMILHLGPTEDHKEDAHFIKTLRKVSVNQVAHALFVEIRDETKARIKAAEEAQKLAEASHESAEETPA